VVVGALAENCRSLKKITLTTCKLTAAAVRRLFCKCRGLLSIVETLEWSAEHTLAAEECAALLDCISLHDALLGNVATDTSLFAHLQHVCLGRDFLVSTCAAAAMSCMRTLQTVEFHPGDTDDAGEVDLSAVLRAIAFTCTQL
jgi:hypothetical protein